MDHTSSTPKPTPIAIWWIIWFALIIGVTVVYSVAKPDDSRALDGGLRYLPIMPLILSALIRWFVLPKFKQAGQAFPFFIIGLALAEACAILGIFLVPSLKATYFTLALLGMAQFIPLFAQRFK